MRKRAQVQAGLGLAIGLFAAAAAVGQARWVGLGPFGARVYRITVDPGNGATVYLGTDSGIFKSVDGGALWSHIGNGIPDNRTVLGVGVDPTNSQRLYAGVSDGVGRRDVYTSADAGANWTLASALGADLFLFDPTNSNVIYGSSFSKDGVIKSIDGGATWSQMNNGLSPTRPIIRDMALAASAPMVLYCASEGDLYKTADGGGLWTSVGGGLPSGTVTAVAVDPTDADLVYAGLDGNNGLHKSTDGGVIWTRLNAAPSTITHIVIDPVTPSVLWAGDFPDEVERSADGGVTWARADTGLGLDLIEALTIDPSNPAVLYAGGNSEGVFKTSNSGSLWSEVSQGLTDLSVNEVAVDPADPDRLYAAVTAGLLVSVDGGIQWTELSDPLVDEPIRSLVIDPLTPSTVYAIGFCCGTVLKSLDGGVTWAPANSGIEGVSPRVLAMDPVTPSSLYVGTTQQVFRSTDGGGLWSPGSGLAANVTQLAIDPVHPTTLYASTLDADSMYRSLDGGATWSAARTGLPLGAQVGTLAMDSGDPLTLLASASSSMHVTTDGALNWSPSPGFFPGGLDSLEPDPARAATFYAGAGSPLFSRPVRRTIDGGATWSPLDLGLPAVSVEAITFDPSDDHLLYASTSRGVFRLDLCPPELTLGDHAAEGSEIHSAEQSLFVSGQLAVPAGASLILRSEAIVVEEGGVIGSETTFQALPSPCG